MKYSELLVWQKAMDLVTHIYCLTRNFPCKEKYGLSSQMQKSAVSIPGNIGHGRKSTRAYLNHLSIATGSLMELEIQIQISARLSYLDSKTLNDVLARTDEIGKMLSGLRGSLNPQSSILNPE